jgi:4'-phosphopantetheinyl transferase
MRRRVNNLAMVEAKLVVAPLRPGESGEWTLAAERALTDAERASADRLSPAVRLGHVIGRAVLRLLAAQVIDAATPQMVTVAETAEGRPFLPQAPELRVSVAHSEGAVAVASCGQADIGVDVDSLSRFTPNVHRLAGRVFAPDEAARMAELAPGAAGVEFMRHWIIKEAVGKALGTGYVPALRGAELEPDPTDAAFGRRLKLKSVWGGPAAEDWTLHCVDVPGGDEWIAVAVAAPNAVLRPPLRLTPAQLRPEGFALGF